MTAQVEHDVVTPGDDRYDEGYSQAWVARGAVQNTDDCYLPVPLPWRLVNVGDTVVSPAKVVDGVVVEPPRKWTIKHINHKNAYRRIGVEAQCGDKTLRAGLDGDNGLDPDAQVLVLEAAPLAQAEAVLRAQFTDARILARTETRST